MKIKIIILVLSLAVASVAIFNGEKPQPKLGGALYPSAQVFIQVRFKKDTRVGRYSDNLLFTEAEYAKLTAQDINDKIDERVSSYVYARENEPAPVEPTVEELEKYKKSLDEELLEIKSKIEAKK